MSWKNLACASFLLCAAYVPAISAAIYMTPTRSEPHPTNLQFSLNEVIVECRCR
jgi:hypothetical protein